MEHLWQFGGVSPVRTVMQAINKSARTDRAYTTPT